MKRFALVLIAALAIAMVMSGVAYANFGPHGGYADDTDGCAGCHRAHTSFSTLTWTGLDGVGGRSALLISDSSTMTDFCYVCHGEDTIGASTNVEGGVFDTGPTVVAGVDPATDGDDATLYSSNSTLNEQLNGGAFAQMADDSTVLSTHNMDHDANTGSNWMWGYIDPDTGSAQPQEIVSFRCTSCHDVHGSTNYRLLRDQVQGWNVGGFEADGTTPKPRVISNEQNYPFPGFRKYDWGQLQKDAYVPNYTDPYYAYREDADGTYVGMSQWCAGCHTAYIIANDTYAPTTTDLDGGGTYTENDYDYSNTDAEDLITDVPPGVGSGLTEVGELTRHRHPVDIELSIGQGVDRALTVETVDDERLPLEMPSGDLGSIDASDGAGAGTYTQDKPWENNGRVSCLTCHWAHGSDADMAGWAVAGLTDAGDGSDSWENLETIFGSGDPLGADQGDDLLGNYDIVPVMRAETESSGDERDAGSTYSSNLAGEFDGINPSNSEALLRIDNRGVCQACHDK